MPPHPGVAGNARRDLREKLKRKSKAAQLLAYGSGFNSPMFNNSELQVQQQNSLELLEESKRQKLDYNENGMLQSQNLNLQPTSNKNADAENMLNGTQSAKNNMTNTGLHTFNKTLSEHRKKNDNSLGSSAALENQEDVKLLQMIAKKRKLLKERGSQEKREQFDKQIQMLLSNESNEKGPSTLGYSRQ